jgi:hypothetical protein
LALAALLASVGLGALAPTALGEALVPLGPSSLFASDPIYATAPPGDGGDASGNVTTTRLRRVYSAA